MGTPKLKRLALAWDHPHLFLARPRTRRGILGKALPSLGLRKEGEMQCTPRASGDVPSFPEPAPSHAKPGSPNSHRREGNWAAGPGSPRRAVGSSLGASPGLTC